VSSAGQTKPETGIKGAGKATAAGATSATAAKAADASTSQSKVVAAKMSISDPAFATLPSFLRSQMVAEKSAKAKPTDSEGASGGERQFIACHTLLPAAHNFLAFTTLLSHTPICAAHC
jgi:hypothetical protein